MIKTVSPQTHMFKIHKCIIIRFYPVRAINIKFMLKKNTYNLDFIEYYLMKAITKKNPPM